MWMVASEWERRPPILMEAQTTSSRGSGRAFLHPHGEQEQQEQQTPSLLHGVDSYNNPETRIRSLSFSSSSSSMKGGGDGLNNKSTLSRCNKNSMASLLDTSSPVILDDLSLLSSPPPPPLERDSADDTDSTDDSVYTTPSDGEEEEKDEEYHPGKAVKEENQACNNDDLIDTSNTSSSSLSSSSSSTSDTGTVSVHWADQMGLPLVSETIWLPAYEEQATNRIVILLMNETASHFEFVHCEYDTEERLLVSDVMEQLEHLMKQPGYEHSKVMALCTGTVEMIHRLALQDYNVKEGDMLLGVCGMAQPKKVMFVAAKVFQHNFALSRSIRRARICGYSLQTLKSSRQMQQEREELQQQAIVRDSDCNATQEEERAGRMLKDEDDKIQDSNRMEEGVGRMRLRREFLLRHSQADTTTTTASVRDNDAFAPMTNPALSTENAVILEAANKKSNIEDLYSKSKRCGDSSHNDDETEDKSQIVDQWRQRWEFLHAQS